MLKIIIPLKAILLTVVLLSVLNLLSDVKTEAQDGDIEGAADKVAEYVVEEAESEAKNAILAPILSILAPIIIAVAGLFGIKLIFR